MAVLLNVLSKMKRKGRYIPRGSIYRKFNNGKTWGERFAYVSSVS
jgi:hypothetical protein